MKANDGISISKKASLLCGADFFGTRAISDLDIPRLQLLDGGTGMNFEQLFVDQYASYCEVNGYTRTELDNVAHFYFEEGKLTENDSNKNPLKASIYAYRLANDKMRPHSVINNLDNPENKNISYSMKLWFMDDVK